MMGPERVVEISAGVFTASGRINPEEDFFQDHFPGFALLPGVLMLEILLETAEAALRLHGTEVRVKVRSVPQVKYAAFLRPGDEWEARMECGAREAGGTLWAGKLSSGGRTVCSAKLLLEHETVLEPLMNRQGGN